MTFQDIVQTAQQSFPNIKVAYKDQSIFMKILGKLMFFNPSFMTNYITTIGSTIYYPSEAYIAEDEFSNSIIFMHELMHISDSKKYSKILFSISYLFPQILLILFLPLFLINWKIALPLVIFSALPLPAYFRMWFERRGYFVSAYVEYNGREEHLEEISFIVEQCELLIA